MVMCENRVLTLKKIDLIDESCKACQLSKNDCICKAGQCVGCDKAECSCKI